MAEDWEVVLKDCDLLDTGDSLNTDERGLSNRIGLSISAYGLR